MSTPRWKPVKNDALHARTLMARLENRGLLARVTETALAHWATADEVCGRSRDRRIVRARHAVWRRLQAECAFSGLGLARLWGCDHTTIRTARLRGSAEATP